jgi:hypothetical protein
MHKQVVPIRIGGLTWKQIVEAIQTRPTVEVWPIAGPALGYRSKSAAYSAARKGLIRVLEQGRKRPVPTPWLRQVLGLKTRRRWLNRKGVKGNAAKGSSIVAHDVKKAPSP